MKEIFKKKKLVFILVIIGLIFIITGIAYAFFSTNMKGIRDLVIDSGENLTFTYEEKTNGVSLTADNSQMTDAEGIAQATYFDFEVSLTAENSTTINYYIYLTKDNTSTLSDSNVLVYLTDQSNTQILEPTIVSNLLSHKTYSNSSYLYGTSITSSGTKVTQLYRLRVWVNNEYSTLEETNNDGEHHMISTAETYKFTVNIETGEIPKPNAPELLTGMIPVYYDSTNEVWKKADSTNSNSNYKWYEYGIGTENKQWANAVTVTSTNRATYQSAALGTEIPMTDINTMWVWIPRFSAVTPSNYNGGTAAAPGAISITFVNNTTTALDAFTFGEQTLSGFWYGKFETSHSTLAGLTTDNNLGCTTETCSNANGLLIKPDVQSLVYNDVSNFFMASRSMEQSGNAFGFDNTLDTTLDTHMSKNNEWGAVAYLTHSIYGRCTSSTSCTEVYINNSGYLSYTGRSGGNVGGSTPINGTYTDQTSTTQYNTYGFYTYDGYLLSYDTNTKTTTKDISKVASTTGNIYGIYDMSGGKNEYVMGNYNNTIGASGFINIPDTKYYNLYTNDTSYTGHALTETEGWYGSTANFTDSYFPWFLRGGAHYPSIPNGIFDFLSNDGDCSSSSSGLGGTFSSRISVVK